MPKDTPPTVIHTPDRVIPLDQVHYDSEIGLHQLADCAELHGRRDAYEAGATLRERADILDALKRHQEDAETRELHDLAGVELLEDMLVNLREIARRVRYRHQDHFQGRRITEQERAGLLLETRAVRSLARMLLGVYPLPPGPDPDHRDRGVNYPWGTAAGKEQQG